MDTHSLWHGSGPHGDRICTRVDGDRGMTQCCTVDSAIKKLDKDGRSTETTPGCTLLVLKSCQTLEGQASEVKQLEPVKWHRVACIGNLWHRAAGQSLGKHVGANAHNRVLKPNHLNLHGAQGFSPWSSHCRWPKMWHQPHAPDVAQYQPSYCDATCMMLKDAKSKCSKSHPKEPSWHRS